MGCSLRGSSVHGIFQAIVLERIAIFFSKGSSRPRDRTQVSHIVDRCLTVWATREVQLALTNWNEKNKASTINSTSETILGFDFFFYIMGYKSEIMY